MKNEKAHNRLLFWNSHFHISKYMFWCYDKHCQMDFDYTARNSMQSKRPIITCNHIAFLSISSFINLLHPLLQFTIKILRFLLAPSSHWLTIQLNGYHEGKGQEFNTLLICVLLSNITEISGRERTVLWLIRYNSHIFVNNFCS